MKVVLWILQILLGAGFLYSGWLKAFQYETAKATWTWVADVPQGLVNFIGAVELLGVLGLILPTALRIKPILTPIAAVGLAVVSLSGGIFHLMRNESDVVINIVFLVLASAIAVGRFRLKGEERGNRKAPAGRI